MRPHTIALLLALAFVAVGLVLWLAVSPWLGVLSLAAGVALALYVALGRLS